MGKISAWNNKATGSSRTGGFWFYWVRQFSPNSGRGLNRARNVDPGERLVTSTRSSTETTLSAGIPTPLPRTSCDQSRCSGRNSKLTHGLEKPGSEKNFIQVLTIFTSPPASRPKDEKGISPPLAWIRNMMFVPMTNLVVGTSIFFLKTSISGPIKKTN